MKALVFLPSVEANIGDDCASLVGNKLLNNICNQLTSLHIGDYAALFWYGSEMNNSKWKFLEYSKCSSYPCTKREMTEKETRDMKKQSWFPSNVKELCLFDAMEKWNLFNVPDKKTQHFWHESIKSQLFPNLRRLKIINDLDDKNIKLFGSSDHECSDKLFRKITISNIISLIENGLESIDLTMGGLEYRDFVDELDDDDDKYKHNQNRNPFDPKQIVSFFHEILDEIEVSIVNNKRPFILKLSMDLCPIGRTDYESKVYTSVVSDKMKMNFSNLLNQVGLLFINLSHKFSHNVMFAFKIQFNFTGNWIRYYKTNLRSCIKDCHNSSNNKMLFNNDESKIVFSKLDDSKSHLIVAFVFKNRNKGKLNDNCDNCFMDPKFDYQCLCCQSQPWINSAKNAMFELLNQNH